MKTKIKIIIAAVTILILTVITVVYYQQQKNKITKATVENENVQSPTIDEGNKKNDVYDEAEPATAKGTIVGFKDNELEIKNSETQIKLSLDENVFVYVVDNASPVKKEKSDLKINEKVELVISKKNSLVTSIKILK